MTKSEAIHDFFSAIMPSYPVSSVPDDHEDSYLTYELRMGAFDTGEMNMTVNMWFYTESEDEPDEMAMKLSKAIGMGGIILPCDGGYVWLKRGSPWCQSLSDGEYKRRYINVSVEFFTAD